MAQVTLLIKPQYVIELTAFDGNIDPDKLQPLIYAAQTTHLRAFLGVDLYTKIYDDFVDDTLSDDYLTIYEDYIKPMLAYRTASLFVEFGGYKVSENGIHKVTAENLQVVDYEETSTLVNRYAELVSNVETSFKDFVSDLQLPELSQKIINLDSNFPWL